MTPEQERLLVALASGDENSDLRPEERTAIRALLEALAFERDPRPDGRDGTERLCRAVYGHQPRARYYIGGSEAPMLHAGADLIERLKAQVETLSDGLDDAMGSFKGIYNGVFVDPIALHPDSLRSLFWAISEASARSIDAARKAMKDAGIETEAVQEWPEGMRPKGQVGR